MREVVSALLGLCIVSIHKSGNIMGAPRGLSMLSKVKIYELNRKTRLSKSYHLIRFDGSVEEL